MRVIIACCLFVFAFLSQVAASHFIVGFVADANDGTSADGHTIVLWKPSNQHDYLADVIGRTGNSGSTHTFLFDCTTLQQPCLPGDELRLRVINTGDGYSTCEVSVIVSEQGFDVAPNLTLIKPRTFVGEHEPRC